MKKLLILLFLLASPAFATTYYATSSTVNIDQANLWVPTSTGSCTGSGTALVWASRANGDVFNANGCTALAVNVDPGVATGASANTCGSVTVKVSLQSDPTNGGVFNYATASNLVLHTDIVGGKVHTLVITGSTGGGTLCGNVTGGTGASQEGLNDIHQSVMFYVVGNVSGSAVPNGDGYYWAGNTTNQLTITGNAIGGTGSLAYGIKLLSNGSATLNGACIGNDSGNGPGCGGNESGTGSNGILNVNGSLISGKIGNATGARVFLTQSPTNYTVVPSNGSYALSNCWSGTALTLATCTNAIISTMPPGLTCPTGCTTSTNSSVTNGVTFGPYTGSSTGSSVSAQSSW